MNKVTLIGRTTKDIELRQAGQTSVVKFTLAVNRRKPNEADFINCTAFGKTAEVLEKYVHKGDRVGIAGRIQTGSYEKEGQRHYTTDVIVDELEFLERKGEARTQEDQQDYSPATDIVDDDDLPF